MGMTTKAQADIRRKLKVLNYVKENGNVSRACRFFGIARPLLYVIKGQKLHKPIIEVIIY